jgi:hypothetical protein
MQPHSAQHREQYVLEMKDGRSEILEQAPSQFNVDPRPGKGQHRQEARANMVVEPADPMSQ